MLKFVYDIGSWRQIEVVGTYNDRFVTGSIHTEYYLNDHRTHLF